jgi:hypothetical protein
METIDCPGCQEPVSVPVHFFGKRVKCTRCSHAFRAKTSDPIVEIDEEAEALRLRGKKHVANSEGDGQVVAVRKERMPRRKRRPPAAQTGMDGLSSEFRIDPGEWFRYAGMHYSRVLGPMIGFTLLYAAVCLAAALLGKVTSTTIVGGIFSFLVAPVLLAGQTLVCLAQLKGRRWSFVDFFGGYRFFVPIVVCALISGLTFVGASYLGRKLDAIALEKGQAANNMVVFVQLVLIQMMVFAGGAFVLIRIVLFGVPLIIDRGLGPIEAIRASWLVTSGHFLGLLGMSILLLLIVLAGVAMLGVGVLFTIPYAVLALNAGYLLAAGSRLPVDR